MSEGNAQLETKSVKSLIDQFNLKDLPQGVKHMIELTETRLNKGKIDDGDIENMFATVRQGYVMENKKLPEALTQQSVREFYTTTYKKV